MKKTALWIICILAALAFLAVYTMQQDEGITIGNTTIVRPAVVDDVQDVADDVEADAGELADDVEDVIQGIIDEVEAEIAAGTDAVEEAVDQAGDDIQDANDNNDVDGDTDTGDADDSEEVADEDTEVVVVANEGFVEYSPEVVDAALAADQNVVLFFHAGRCPSCLALEDDINENLADLDENTRIIKVDYDTQEELKAQYGVTAQHTLVYLDADGNEIKKERASATLSDVESNID